MQTKVNTCGNPYNGTYRPAEAQEGLSPTEGLGKATARAAKAQLRRRHSENCTQPLLRGVSIAHTLYYIRITV